MKILNLLLVLFVIAFSISCVSEKQEGGLAYTGKYPENSYSFATNKGYIESWSYSKAPAEIKKAFSDGAGGNVFDKLDGSKAVSLFQERINEEQWEYLFPNRKKEYYTYESFINALKIIGKYAYLTEIVLESSDPQSADTTSQRNYILYKNSGSKNAVIRLVSQSDDFFTNEEELKSRARKYIVVDYASFGTEGTDNDKKRVIAGFLANASHETSDGHAKAEPSNFDTSKFVGTFTSDIVSNEKLSGILSWALFYNEEIAFAGVGTTHYSDTNHRIFPAYPEKSYHGRGAFQLSWNYNYGLASSIFFGDSRVLLQNPDYILKGIDVPKGYWLSGEKISGGTMAFLTSLMFWLTPQKPKPSQQDVMILNTEDGKYVENTTPNLGTIETGIAKLQEDKIHGKPGFGWTIVIMNGYWESDKSYQSGNPKYDGRIARRVYHYKFFNQALGGVINESEQLDTVGYKHYAF